MAAAVFTLADSLSDGSLAADIKQAILKSSDWAHLQLTTGTQNTTLAAAISSTGATSMSTTATIPASSYVVIGNGSANPEVRFTTSVSGAGPFTVSWTKPLVNTYSNGAAVGVGSYCKATTTRGAQMVIDLADAAVTANIMQIGIYRSHDGTTAVDKVTRYLRWRNGGSGNPVTHYEVSVSKESLFFAVEGPRGGETNADDSTYGSAKQSLALADIVPYFGGDTVPTVCLAGHLTNLASDTTLYCNVGRDQGNATSWTQARLATLGAPLVNTGTTYYFLQRRAKGDGNDYLWPYVVVEGIDGLRGRMNNIFFVGYNNSPQVGISGEAPPTAGEIVTYNSVTYRLVNAFKGLVSNFGTGTALGANGNTSTGNQYGPVIAVPAG